MTPTALPDIEPATDPAYRRHLADIVHESVMLADAVERAIPCSYGQRQYQCPHPAVWIAHPPCGCLVFDCDPHYRLDLAMLTRNIFMRRTVLCQPGGHEIEPSLVTWTKV